MKNMQKNTRVNEEDPFLRFSSLRGSNILDKKHAIHGTNSMKNKVLCKKIFKALTTLFSQACFVDRYLSIQNNYAIF